MFVLTGHYTDFNDHIIDSIIRRCPECRLNMFAPTPGDKLPLNPSSKDGDGSLCSNPGAPSDGLYTRYERTWYVFVLQTLVEIIARVVFTVAWKTDKTKPVSK